MKYAYCIVTAFWTAIATSMCADIHFGAQKNIIKVIEDALQQGVDVDERDHNGLTALYWAAHHNNKKAMAFLLQHGANPHLKIHPNDNNQMTVYQRFINQRSLFNAYKK